MGWNQCHCEDYQIINPKTIHGSRLQLEWLRYHENCVNVLIDAPLTSESHNFWPLEFQVPYLFGNRKSRSFQGFQHQPDLRPFKNGGPRKACWGYNRPQVPSDPKKKKKDFSGFVSLPGCSLHIFPLFQTLKKNTSKPLDSFFLTKNTRYCPYTQSSSPWFYTSDLRFRCVDVAF